MGDLQYNSKRYRCGGFALYQKNVENLTDVKNGQQSNFKNSEDKTATLLRHYKKWEEK